MALIIGAVLMIIGGVTEIVFGVKAERMRLEGIAKPLTAVSSAARRTAAGARTAVGTVPRPRRPATG